MALIYLYSFGKVITQPDTPYSKYIISKGGTGYKIKPSLGWFVCEVLSFSDVFGVLTLETDPDEPKGTELT